MIRKRLVFSVIGLLIGAGLIIMYFGYQSTKPLTCYQNPVFQPVLADPSIIRGKDGYFYAYGTEDDWGDGQGAHAIPIIRSKDLIRWNFVHDAFITKPNWKDSGGLWAPDISLHKNGKYYLYYAYSLWGDPNPGIGVATADTPAGPFDDHGALFTSESIGVENSIDPQYFQDEDGKSYLFWGSFHGIYGIQLSEDGLHTVGDKFQIAGNQFEAPYVIKRGGYYYFFGSGGSCCDGAYSTYHVMVGRAKTVQGPYIDKDGNDLLVTGGTTILNPNSKPDKNGKQFVGPGHNAIIKDDKGNDWIVYHAIDPNNPTLLNGATKRPLMIDQLIWKDGWPSVNNLEPSTETEPSPYVK
jgi:arabinan endo-1,5-alpha-L-arabinosidase